MVKTVGLATIGVAVLSFSGGFAGATHWMTHDDSPATTTQFAHIPQRAATLAVDTGNTGLDLISWQRISIEPDEIVADSSVEQWPTVEPFSEIDHADFKAEAEFVPYIGSSRTDLEQS
jgi:hypothetical protein